MISLRLVIGMSAALAALTAPSRAIGTTSNPGIWRMQIPRDDTTRIRGNSPASIGKPSRTTLNAQDPGTVRCIFAGLGVGGSRRRQIRLSASTKSGGGIEGDERNHPLV